MALWFVAFAGDEALAAGDDRAVAESFEVSDQRIGLAAHEQRFAADTQRELAREIAALFLVGEGVFCEGEKRLHMFFGNACLEAGFSALHEGAELVKLVVVDAATPSARRVRTSRERHSRAPAPSPETTARPSRYP
jgi:hypothetical protein